MKARRIPIEKGILVLAAAFASYNYGLAGGVIEGTTFSAGGLVAGIVVNVSLAIAASRFGQLRGERRQRQALTTMILLIALTPAVVAPAIYTRLPETYLGSWILRAGWSTLWPLVADLAIVLAGATTGKGLIRLEEDSKPAEQPGKQPRKKAKLARKRVTDQELMAYFASNPGASHRQAAEHFGISRQAIGPRVHKLYSIDTLKGKEE